MQRLPEPVRHPSVARAALSPSAAVLAAGGVSIGLFGDQSVILAVVLGVAGWGGRVLFSVVRQGRRDKAAQAGPAALDPWSYPEPWKALVTQALGAQSRFDDTVRQWPAGPLKDRLSGLKLQVYDAVRQIGAMARRGAALEGIGAGGVATHARPDPEEIARQLRDVASERNRSGGQSPVRDASLAKTEEALAAQLRSLRAAEEAAQELRDRLRVVVTRLEEAVTSTLVLSYEGGERGGVEALAVALSALGEEISALRDGLSDAGRLPQAEVARPEQVRQIGPARADEPPSAPPTP
jgi:hypothetical protein